MKEYNIIIDTNKVIDLAYNNIDKITAMEILDRLSEDKHFMSLINHYIKDHIDDYIKESMELYYDSIAD